MDIDFILNGSKRKKQPKDSLFNLFKGQGNPITGDKVTKSQRQVLKSKKNLFGDWDKDGVINGLDCQPRNKKRHMAWRKPESVEYIQEMSPREYLKQTKTENFGRRNNKYDEIYYDNDLKKSQNIKQLGKHIQDPNKEVNIPFVEPDGNHEGRHRAYAAEKMGYKTIPVKVPPPKEWRTDKVINSYLEKRNPFNKNDMKDWQKNEMEMQGKKWTHRIKNNNFPEETMDIKQRKAYAAAVRENAPHKEVRDTI